MDAVKRLKFLTRLQRLLGEGDFSATYKFALLQGIADICVESEEPRVGELLIPIEALAEKFISYYWQQSSPFGVVDDEPMVLKQNAGRPAAVLSAIHRFQASTGFTTPGTGRLQHPDWIRLKSKVASIVRVMPLWKLQVIGREVDEFIYRQGHLEDDCIRLLPGVQGSFRAFHGLVTHLVRGAWLQKVRALNASNGLLGDKGDLESFLFGTRRSSLERFRDVLEEVQSGICFYCNKPVKGSGHADHFIPWARYPNDLGHNFVFAHGGCNTKKRDFLPGPMHLEHWLDHLVVNGSTLEDAFSSKGLMHDWNRTWHVAYWAYEQGESGQAHTWSHGEGIAPLATSWRDRFACFARVAEQQAGYSPRPVSDV